MGWWFGRKSAPADVRPFVPAWLQSDATEVGFARSYSEQVDEIYRRNPVGQRAVRLVAGMLGSLTIDVVEGDVRAGELVQADGLLEGVAANLLLHGNAYVQVIADAADRPAELVQLRPERVSVVSDERGWPVGYLYRAAGRTERLDKDDALGRRQVAHVKALWRGPAGDQPCDLSGRGGTFGSAGRSPGGLTMGIIDGELTSIALCWRLERRDGAGLGLTSHDQAVTLDEVEHRPEPGMTPAAITRSLGLEAQSAEAAGVLSSNTLDAGDLALGRWDGASVQLSAIDWMDPNAGSIQFLGGEIGSVSINGESFSADLNGAAAKLDGPVCPSTSAECRAELGDKKCRVDLAGRALVAHVVATNEGEITLDRAVGGEFLLGRLRYLSGANCGVSTVTLATDGSRVVIRDLPRAPIETGCRIELREGCDKRFATCVERFDNALNFRGEPHLPGNDLLTRYPGA